ncbi:DUF1877 family protein [Leptospira licerasiae]|uniref:DUF1877 family protein n=1 Tax=Leptospira licerasiae TaxID=447106 RepID=UPI001FEDCD37|nr:DUF1877 family protein [Leptospira licerasiae]
MGVVGICYSVNDRQHGRLLNAANDWERFRIHRAIENRALDGVMLSYLDKSFEILYKCLCYISENNRKSYDSKNCLFGGRHLFEDKDQDAYIVEGIDFVNTTKAISRISRNTFDNVYELLYPNLAQLNYYSWTYFIELRDLYTRSVLRNMSGIVFATDSVWIKNSTNAKV